MYSWERLTSVCGVGCKVFLSPWAWSADEKLAYDSVNIDENEATYKQDTVTSEPQKPVWSDLAIGAPIVRNKSGSVGNIKTAAGYSKLPVNGITASAILANVSEKRNSNSDLTGSIPTVSRSLLKESKDLSSSRASLAEEVLHVHELVTTV